MIPEFPPNPRAELESKVTALLLGELPPNEAAYVREQIAGDPELAGLRDRLSQTLDLVRESSATPVGPTPAQPAPLKLSADRREKLLAQFKTIKPNEFEKKWPIKRAWLLPIAAAAAALVLCAIIIPHFITARTSSMLSADASNLRFIDAAKQQWALEQHQGPDAIPTTSDLVPYLGHGSGGEFPYSPFDGEKYVIGKVGEPPVGLFESGRNKGKVITVDGKLVALNEWGREFGPTVGMRLPEPSQRRKPSLLDVLPPASSVALKTATANVILPQSDKEDGGKTSQVKGEPEMAAAFTGGAIGNASQDRDRDRSLEKKRALESLADWPKVQAPLATAPMSLTASEPAPAPVASAGPAPAVETAPSVASTTTPLFFGSPQVTAPTAATLTPIPGGIRENLPSVPTTVASAASAPSQKEPVTSFTFANSGALADGGVSFDSLGVDRSRSQSPTHGATAMMKNDRNGDKGLNSWSGSYGLTPTPATSGTLALNASSAASANSPAFNETGQQSQELDSYKLTRSRRIGTENGGTILQGFGNSLRNSGVFAQQAERAGETKALQPVENSGADLPISSPTVPAPTPLPEVFISTNAFTTFSLNVSDVAFKLAQASLQNGSMPEVGSLRTEEFINAFDYRDPDPPPGAPIGFAWERAEDPFAHHRDFVRFSIKAAAQGREAGRPLNLVLLLDKSGSMERADRVAIIAKALEVLASQLQANDTLSVVVFARSAHLFADGVSGKEAAEIAKKLRALTPEGGTNLEEAMKLAYATAMRHYLANGENRVVLMTDGAANLGNVDPVVLKKSVEDNRKQGIAFDCFGVGFDGYNDNLLEQLSRAGNGRYGFLNTPEEAATEFAGKLAGALRVAAADVKVQVEFNPKRVTSYRQIGYAKDLLKKEDFRNNEVKAAQIGAAESGTALYTVEINPAGEGDICAVHVRFRVPGTENYEEHQWSVSYDGSAVPLDKASPAMRLCATAASFCEWLANSPYAGEVTPEKLLGLLNGVPRVYGADERPAKLETMILQARKISGK